MRGLLGEGDAPVPVPSPAKAAKADTAPSIQAGQQTITAAALPAIIAKPSTPNDRDN
jgi:hypothetical protein